MGDSIIRLDTLQEYVTIFWCRAHKGRPAENHPYVGYSETCDAITESVTELGNKWKVTYVRDSLHDKLTIGTDSDVELGSADKIQSRRGSRAGLLSSSIN